MVGVEPGIQTLPALRGDSGPQTLIRQKFDHALGKRLRIVRVYEHAIAVAEYPVDEA